MKLLTPVKRLIYLTHYPYSKFLKWKNFIEARQGHLLQAKSSLNKPVGSRSCDLIEASHVFNKRGSSRVAFKKLTLDNHISDKIKMLLLPENKNQPIILFEMKFTILVVE